MALKSGAGAPPTRIVDKGMRGLFNLKRLGRRSPSSLRCSFCGRRADDVDRLVAGASAYICEDCVTKCVAVLADNGGFEIVSPAR